MTKEKIPNFPYAGTKRRYEIWEKESVPVINLIQEMEKRGGFKLPEPLQKIKGNELTPEQAVDIDSRALRNPNCPSIVFGRPHAGEFMPGFLLDRINKEAQKTLVMIDRGTNDIFRSEHIPSVGTKISRFFIDPNRAPLLEMDSVNPKALGKVLWYKGVFGEDIYKEGQKPSKEEVENLVERLYLPYYNGMMGTIGSLTDRRKNKKERILVIDGHSFMVSNDFKFVWDNYGIKDPKELSLFILGDREGESCDRDIRDAFAKSLEKNFHALTDKEQEALFRNSKSKQIVGVNEYLKGVHNVQFYGQRQEGVNSIQLELNEGMYVNEVDDNYYNASYIKDNVAIVKKIIEKACLSINDVLKKKK